jgi:methionyl-tRNA formyltransferase
VAAYGQILPEDILAVPTLGSVNVHASLLPKYRGAAPINRAILNGDDETGVTIMHMAKKLDAGDIISMRSTPILPEDDAVTLFEKLATLGAELVRDDPAHRGRNGDAHAAERRGSDLRRNALTRAVTGRLEPERAGGL